MNRAVEGLALALRSTLAAALTVGCGEPLVVDLRTPEPPGRFSIVGGTTHHDLAAGDVAWAPGWDGGPGWAVVSATDATDQPWLGGFALALDQGPAVRGFDEASLLVGLDAPVAVLVAAADSPTVWMGLDHGAGVIHQVVLESAPAGAVVELELGPGAAGDRVGDRFGAALSLGDFDGDGEADLAVGAPGFDGEVGWVGVIAAADLAAGAGPSAAALSATSDRSGDALGAVVSLSGDLNGDGVADLVTCAPGFDGQGDDDGTCAVVWGGATAALDGGSLWMHADVWIIGGETDDRMGDGAHSVAVADVTGDGADDLVVGMPGWGDRTSPGGAVAVVPGPLASGRPVIEDAALWLTGSGAAGAAVAAGPGGLLVGAPATDAAAGAAGWVAGDRQGVTDLAAAAEVAWAGAGGDRLGSAAALGSVLPDGRRDLLLAAPGAASGGRVDWLLLPSIEASSAPGEGRVAR